MSLVRLKPHGGISKSLRIEFSRVSVSIQALSGFWEKGQARVSPSLRGRKSCASGGGRGVRKVGRRGQRRELCLQVALPLGRARSEGSGGGPEWGRRRAQPAGPRGRSLRLRAGRSLRWSLRPRAASALPNLRSDLAGNELTTSPL